jgi:hypothetical protein
MTVMYATPSYRSRNELGNCGARKLDEQPDADKLEGAEQSAPMRQQAQYNEAEADIVRLGQGVQACQRVREAQQANRSRHEEKRTG